MMRTGIDLVFIPRIRQLLTNAAFLKKVFHDEEMQPPTPEHLAGIFAAKEAFFKALGKDPDWLRVHIKKEQGMPTVHTTIPLNHASISISHEKEYAVAHVLIDL